MNLQLLTDEQIKILYQQQCRYLLPYAYTDYDYKECSTIHEIKTRYSIRYVDCKWFYWNGDIFVSKVSFTTKEIFDSGRKIS